MAVVPQPHGGEVTVWSATQIPHILKIMLTATTGMPEHKLRVIAPAVGGGFGSKLDVYAEELIALAVARQLSVPVRWTEGRSENAHATIQGRGQIQDIELAADADGKVTAVRVHLLADMGAYLQLVTPGIPLLGAFLYHGALRRPRLLVHVHGGVHQQDAHRRLPRRRVAPRPPTPSSGPWTRWRGQVGVGPDEIRRRNFIPTEAFPYSSCRRARVRQRRLRAEPGAGARAGALGRPQGRAGQAPGQRRPGGARPRHLHLRRDVRPGPEPGAGVAPLRRRRLGGGHRAHAAHRHGAGGHRRHAPRAGPRDHVVDARGRQARREPRRRRGAPQRHGHLAHRHGHLRLAVAGGRRHRHRAGRRPGRSTRRGRSPPTSWR